MQPVPLVHDKSHPPQQKIYSTLTPSSAGLTEEKRVLLFNTVKEKYLAWSEKNKTVLPIVFDEAKLIVNFCCNMDLHLERRKLLESFLREVFDYWNKKRDYVFENTELMRETTRKARLQLERDDSDAKESLSKIDLLVSKLDLLGLNADPSDPQVPSSEEIFYIKTFSTLLYKRRFELPITIKEAFGTSMSGGVDGPIASEFIAVKNRYTQFLLGVSLPYRQFQRQDYNLPSFQSSVAMSFDFVDLLNIKKLRLPKNYFLKHVFYELNDEEDFDEKEILDSALSRKGLDVLMEHYTAEHKMAKAVFMDSDSFIAEIKALKVQAEKTGAVACLVCFNKSKRHVTGFYFRHQENEVTVFLFDSMGLTLPGYPCGQRMYAKSYIDYLPQVLTELLKQNIAIAIMPINTVLSLQRDRFSCLMATILFFEAMRLGYYETIDTPGITNSYGDTTFQTSGKNIFFTMGAENYLVKLFVSHYPPLLAGIQSRLAFLFALDSLTISNEILPLLVKYQTDFTDNEGYNIFWLMAYPELLKWLESSLLEKTKPKFPDFIELLDSKQNNRKEKSGFESEVDRIQQAHKIKSSSLQEVCLWQVKKSQPIPVSESHQPAKK